MKTFFRFLSEASDSQAAMQAKKKNLTSDRHGRWMDSSGNVVAHTDKGKLVFYDRKQKKPEEEGGKRGAAQPEPQGRQKQSIFQAPTNLLPDELVKKVLELDKTKYSAVNLYFWGGEAFTNWPFCKAVMNKLANVKYINFMFYTNGVYLKKYKKQLATIDKKLGTRGSSSPWQNNGQRRLHIQVSFDGEPINTLERHTKTGPDEKMSAHVFDSYLDLKESGFSIALKQTISARNFKYLFDVWKWHYDRGIMYGPTPDTHGSDEKRPDGGAWPEGEFGENLKQLKLNMIKISKYCIDRDIIPSNTFRWYGKRRADCGSGMNYLAIDLDGKLYPCHGCMYRQRDDHLAGTSKDNLQDIATTTTEKYMDFLQYADGKNDLKDISNKIKTNLLLTKKIYITLKKNNLAR